MTAAPFRQEALAVAAQLTRMILRHGVGTMIADDVVHSVTVGQNLTLPDSASLRALSSNGSRRGRIFKPPIFYVLVSIEL